MDTSITQESLTHGIEAAMKAPAYTHYLAVRDQVLQMLELGRLNGDQPSAYWREELAGFDYMFDASPLIVQRLREHCYHLTGQRSYDYRYHHRHKSHLWAEKLASLRRIDKSGLLVPESPALGGFGHEIDGMLINVDTLKFYECLIALDRSGVLAPLREEAGRGKLVIEIGGGWGGFAYQFKMLCPFATYLIVDLPQTFLFSGTYLKTVFPEASVCLSLKPVDDVMVRGGAQDFILVPHFLFSEVQVSEPDLAINTVSFQEMTTDQVRRYVRGLRQLGCRRLYSLNRDRSKYNDELTSVRTVIAESYSIEEISVLEAPYTTLGSVAARSRLRRARKIPAHEYRHVLGRC